MLLLPLLPLTAQAAARQIVDERLGDTRTRQADWLSARRQGYAIAKEEIEMSLDDFKAQYAPGGTAIE